MEICSSTKLCEEWVGLGRSLSRQESHIFHSFPVAWVGVFVGPILGPEPYV